MFTILLVFSGLFGLIIGSFINCLAWRLYKEETVMGRSYCPNCRHQLAWHDNIPLLSFICLKGKCRYCHKAISWQYPLIEAAAALLFAASFWLISGGASGFWSWDSASSITLARDWLAISILLLVFIFDWRWMMIPVDALIWTGPIIAILGFWSFPYGLGSYIFALLATLLIAFVFFGSQYYLTQGKGLGAGDIWLGLFLACLFPQSLYWAIAVMAAYFIGSIIGIGLVLMKKRHLSSKLPLGIFLVPGALITIFWGQAIAYWLSGLAL